MIDLRGGQAVHAQGGNRAHYEPVRSVLHPGSDPVALANAFRERLGVQSVYLADLDAIHGAAPDWDVYRAMVALGLDLWVDAGIRDERSVVSLLDAGVSTIVAGLESLDGPAALRAVLREAGPSRVVFSLDLKNGVPIVAPGAGWVTSSPADIAEEGIEWGVERILLLDLARVGSGQGLGTLPLVSELRAEQPQLEVSVGGGIGRAEELKAVARAGASAVLLGSALHDGRIKVFDGRALDHSA